MFVSIGWTWPSRWAWEEFGSRTSSGNCSACRFCRSTIRAWQKLPSRRSNMDKPLSDSATTPGYETRDANAGGAFKFLMALGIVLVVTALVCWGMFRYFSAHAMDQAASDSPFAGTRQLPLGPQLQVNPRQDWLKFREEQEQSLETYAWVNRTAGTARVPIEVAMQLLVKKGVPVQSTAPAPPAADSKQAAPSPQGGKKP